MSTRLARLTWGPAAGGVAARPVAVTATAPSPERVRSGLEWIVVAMYCIMVASFLFEMPFWHFPYQLPSLTAMAFMGITVLHPKACFQRIPSNLPWFLGYLFAFSALTLWHGWVETNDIARFFLFLVQALLVFWAGANLMRDKTVGRVVLWSFVLACLVRAALPMVGIGRTAYEERWTGGERVTAFGQDPNFSASFLAGGLVTLLCLTYGRIRRPLWVRLLVWPLVALLGVAILDTGSRGGLLALAMGVLAFVFTHTKKLGGRLRNVGGAVLAITALGVGAMQTEIMRGRFEATAEEGSLAGREVLFPALWSMFLEKPFAGWGPQLNQYEIAKRAPFLDHTRRAAHNLFLELLTESGLIGAVPFFVALGLCVRAAWRARAGPWGILPLSLLAVFLTANLSIDMLAHKPLWFILGFTMATEPLSPGGGAPATPGGA